MSPLESINADVFGQILVQLNHVTGTPELVNPKDIPCVYKYARSLACTSRKMNSLFNEELPTQVFLNSMAKRFEKPFKDLAFEFNTRGSLKCVWSYIQTKGFDKDYAEISRIYAIANEYLNVVYSGYPSFNYNVTPSGIKLVINDSESYIATPFGEIRLTFNKCSRSFIQKIEEVYGKTFIVEKGKADYWNGVFDSYPYAMWKMLEAKELGNDPCEPKKGVPPTKRKEPSFKNISQIASWIVQYLDKLVDRRRIEGVRSLSVEMSINQMKLIQLLNDRAKEILNNRGWLLTAQDYVLTLTNNNKACLLIDLAKTFDEILKHLTDNWIPVKLRDHPKVQPLCSEEEFQLFNSNTSKTNGLFLCLMKEFGMFDFYDNKDGDIVLANIDASVFYWVRKKQAIEDTGLFKPGSLIS